MTFVSQLQIEIEERERRREIQRETEGNWRENP